MDQVFLGSPGGADAWFRDVKTAGYTRIVLTDGSEFLVDIVGEAKPDVGYGIVKVIGGDYRIGDTVSFNELMDVLYQVYFGRKVTVLGNDLFYNRESCTCADNLHKVYIPDTVVRIGDGSDSRVFYNCSALEEIVIPDSVQGELNYTCSGSGIRNLVIGSGVEYFGQNPFQDCPELKTIEFRSMPDYEDYPFIYTQNIETAVFRFRKELVAAYLSEGGVFCNMNNETGTTKTVRIVCTDGTYTFTDACDYSRVHEYGGTIFD